LLYRHKPQADNTAASAQTNVLKDAVKPILRPSVHEIVIRNQLMAVEPPLELARVSWVSYIYILIFFLSFFPSIFPSEDSSLKSMRYLNCTNGWG
jgi:hypothetical protein